MTMNSNTLSSSTTRPTIMTIPSEITQLILINMNLQDMANVAATCRYMNDLFNDEVHWARMVEHQFGKIHVPEDRSKSLEIYKKLSKPIHDATEIKGPWFDPAEGHWIRQNVHGSISNQPWVLRRVWWLLGTTEFNSVHPGVYRPEFRMIVRQNGSGLDHISLNAFYVNDAESGLRTTTTTTLGPLLTSIPRDTWVTIKLPILTVTSPGPNLPFHNVHLQIMDTANTLKMGLVLDTMNLRAVKSGTGDVGNNTVSLEVHEHVEFETESRHFPHEPRRRIGGPFMQLPFQRFVAVHPQAASDEVLVPGEALGGQQGQGQQGGEGAQEGQGGQQ
ncbi:hypothetical protein HDU76_013754 [Blyttiomyces sp. JEL0837]|nr:hypothetical protein HDU76_013754 [Blyttiomyces sp. JEL0837]